MIDIEIDDVEIIEYYYITIYYYHYLINIYKDIY